MNRHLTRRQFLRLAFASSLLGMGSLAYAQRVEPDWIDVAVRYLRLPRLDPAFQGYRIVQLSDLHADAWMTPARLETIVALANAQRPDLIAITGDFVTHDPEIYAPSLITALRKLKAPDGVVAILGNHDHWTDADVVRGVIAESNLRYLGNAVYTLARDHALLTIAGVDDYWERLDRLDLVLANLPASGSAILLAHEPDYADISAATGRFDLQLSGHSHGGQVLLPLFGPPVLPLYGRRYPVGRYQVGRMIQYTNRGLGMIHPQVRFNCRPEISVLILESPPQGAEVSHDA